MLIYIFFLSDININYRDTPTNVTSVLRSLLLNIVIFKISVVSDTITRSSNNKKTYFDVEKNQTIISMAGFFLCTAN